MLAGDRVPKPIPFISAITQFICEQLEFKVSENPSPDSTEEFLKPKMYNFETGDDLSQMVIPWDI